MKNFVYSYPTKVYFGENSVEAALAAEMNESVKTVMLAIGGGAVKKVGIYDVLVKLLHHAGKQVIEFSGIMPNPTYDKVQEGAALAKREKVDFILALGGGSVIDCCKIVAAQTKTEEDIWDMEFSAHKFPTDFLPLGAVKMPARSLPILQRLYLMYSPPRMAWKRWRRLFENAVFPQSWVS